MSGAHADKASAIDATKIDFSGENRCAQSRGEGLGAIALFALGTGRETGTRGGVFG